MPHLVPHTPQVGECGQGQEEPKGERGRGRGAQGLAAGVDARGESEPASTVTLPLALLEGSAGTGSCAVWQSAWAPGSYRPRSGADSL